MATCNSHFTLDPTNPANVPTIFSQLQKIRHGLVDLQYYIDEHEHKVTLKLPIPTFNVHTNIRLMQDMRHDLTKLQHYVNHIAATQPSCIPTALHNVSEDVLLMQKIRYHLIHLEQDIKYEFKYESSAHFSVYSPKIAEHIQKIRCDLMNMQYYIDEIKVKKSSVLLLPPPLSVPSLTNPTASVPIQTSIYHTNATEQSVVQDKSGNNVVITNSSDKMSMWWTIAVSQTSEGKEEQDSMELGADVSCSVKQTTVLDSKSYPAAPSTNDKNIVDNNSTNSTSLHAKSLYSLVPLKERFPSLKNSRKRHRVISNSASSHCEEPLTVRLKKNVDGTLSCLSSPLTSLISSPSSSNNSPVTVRPKRNPHSKYKTIQMQVDRIYSYSCHIYKENRQVTHQYHSILDMMHNNGWINQWIPKIKFPKPFKQFPLSQFWSRLLQQRNLQALEITQENENLPGLLRKTVTNSANGHHVTYVRLNVTNDLNVRVSQ